MSPSIFLWSNGEPDEWPQHDDPMDREAWDHVMSLATHVALATSGYAGSQMTRLNQLNSDWTFSWPEPEAAPYTNYPSLIAGEEFDALVFNAMHGYYRQAIGCLRVALETLVMAAGFAVTNDKTGFDTWQSGHLEAKFGRARVLLRDSADGQSIDSACASESIFGDADTAWLNAWYKRLCDYAHSRAGHDNGGFWESNGPVFVPRALDTVEQEFRETLAVCYLLQRLAWPSYQCGRGQPALLAGPTAGWTRHLPVLRDWLL